ncbi:translation elongation factor Ts [Blattabacterium cuenoti]|uniref:translation elongation factor Ts n=1 Tax=Blattabacterium cuenoti TaxID=1653831 RepID=UPI00163C2FC5|nr:translation elongation factor Ts [Blattabacterium cuenoti]
MKITVGLVNQLRKITGIGIMDCKKALIDSNGNMDQAICSLRKKGKKIVINHHSFGAKDGGLISSINRDNSCGSIIGISCETDFLSRNFEFLDFLSMLSEKSLLYNTKEDFLSSSYDEDHNVKEVILYKMDIFGEKLDLKIFEKINSPFVMNYTHFNNKIAVIVGFSYKISDVIAKNIAMHIAAMNPISIDENKFPNSLIKKEIEIIKHQVEKNKNSEKIIKQVIQGKLKKFICNNTLINQKFIKNDKITIREYLNTFNNLKINLFKRISI